MNLNLQILYDEFTNVRSYHFPASSTKRKITTFSSYTPDLQLRQDILYLVPEPIEPAFPDGGEYFFLYLTPDNCQRDYACRGNYLELIQTENYGLPEVIRDLENAFLKYDLWEQELTDALMKKKSISYLCRLGQKVFQNPILVHNPEYEILAAVESDTIHFTYTVREPHTNHLQEALVKDLIFRKDYLDTFNYTSPEYWLDDDDETLSIYMNLFDYSRKYIGRIIIDENQKFGFGTAALLVFFVKFLEATLRNNTIKKLDTLQIFKNSCLEHLSGVSSLRREELKTELLLYGWKPFDAYFCINIQAPTQSVKLHVTPYESLLFDHYIPDCLTLNYQDELVLIFNLTRSSKTREEECAQIAYIVRENLLSAGISTEFSDFFEFPAYYKQAKAARLTGTRLYPTQWLFKFENVALKHVLINGTDSLPFHVLMPATLNSIIKYDQLHGTEYYRTLRNFVLYDKKTADAIEDLYVHRSTFKSRMKKISEMLVLNLNDPDVVFYLKIIIHLLESDAERSKR